MIKHGRARNGKNNSSIVRSEAFASFKYKFLNQFLTEVQIVPKKDD